MNKKQLSELEKTEEINLKGIRILTCWACGMSKYTTNMGDVNSSNVEFDKNSKCCSHPDYRRE